MIIRVAVKEIELSHPNPEAMFFTKKNYFGILN